MLGTVLRTDLSDPGCLTICENVVQENEVRVVKVLLKHLVHKSLKGCVSIRKTKWRSDKLVQASVLCKESLLLPVRNGYENLPISTCQIQKRKKGGLPFRASNTWACLGIE